MTTWKNASTFFHCVPKSGHPNPFDSFAVPALAGHRFSQKLTADFSIITVNFLIISANFKEVFYADMLPM